MAHSYPLRSRAAMAQFILNTGDEAERYGQLCFNVKSYPNLDLDTLDAKIRESAADYFWQGEADDIPADLIKKAYDEANGREYGIWDRAIEYARESLDNSDTYRMIASGKGSDEPQRVTFGFNGRSGGWLCIEEFNGHTFTGMDADDFEALLTTTGEDEEMTFEDVTLLYKLCVQWRTEFSKQAAEEEIQWEAAHAVSSTLESIVNDWIDEMKAVAYRVRDLDDNTVMMNGTLDECDAYAARHNRKVIGAGGRAYLQTEYDPAVFDKLPAEYAADVYPAGPPPADEGDDEGHDDPDDDLHTGDADLSMMGYEG